MTVRAILLAAGKGTRMKSAHPKVLHEVCGRPMLWYAIRALRDAGVDEILVVTNPELHERTGEFGVRSVVQQPQLGTGHAVQVALRELQPGSGRIIVANGDMPLVGAELFRHLVHHLERHGDAAVAMVTARMPLPSNFGRVVREGEFVTGIVEERDCTAEQRAIDEMNAGVYLYDEAALREMVAGLKNDNVQKEYYLTDTIAALARAGKRVVAVAAGDHRDVLGVNDRIELARAGRAMNERLCEQYMAAGVTIIDPHTTYLEPELQIGRDTVIYPNTGISRLSVIGEGCVIGPASRLSNATLGAHTSVRESVVVDSVIGEHGSIGPYAHLRGHSELQSGVKIGNFVEVKNSKLAKGVKANHLSYLGDAEIGEGTNVGAGTITCNYDGTKKNRTKIGKNVSIGSNTSIVAPRTIGDDALTGAGSVVTKDVAPGARVAGNPAKPLPQKS
jgi:bifunctional UDP-N-acetylglucosamine pyrophosphorylase/glucosamine-1-phosphate N-acetyltransferase